MAKVKTPATWWMCLNPYAEGQKPQKRHESFESARAEACRLCLVTGRKIHVLKLAGTMHMTPFWEERP